MGSILDGINRINQLAKKQRSPYVVVITPLGQGKLEKPGVPEYQWRILNHLKEAGACSIRDLARELNTNEERMKTICRQMAEDDGYIKRVGTAIG